MILCFMYFGLAIKKYYIVFKYVYEIKIVNLMLNCKKRIRGVIGMWSDHIQRQNLIADPYSIITGRGYYLELQIIFYFRPIIIWKECRRTRWARKEALNYGC